MTGGVVVFWGASPLCLLLPDLAMKNRPLQKIAAVVAYQEQINRNHASMKERDGTRVSFIGSNEWEVDSRLSVKKGLKPLRPEPTPPIPCYPKLLNSTGNPLESQTPGGLYALCGTINDSELMVGQAGLFVSPLRHQQIRKLPRSMSFRSGDQRTCSDRFGCYYPHLPMGFPSHAIVASATSSTYCLWVGRQAFMV
jgi:hypothetical protein